MPEKMDPIDMAKLVRMEAANRHLGKLIKKAIDQSGGDFGFALLMFSYGTGSEMTWLSNAKRPDMIKALEEFIANVKAGEDDTLGKQERWGGKIS
jgi:hypothetical protein